MDLEGLSSFVFEGVVGEKAGFLSLKTDVSKVVITKNATILKYKYYDFKERRAKRSITKNRCI